MAELSARRTRNPAAPEFESRSGHLLDLFTVASPELKSSATLVNSQLTAYCQLGFFILLCCI